MLTGGASFRSAGSPRPCGAVGAVVINGCAVPTLFSRAVPTSSDGASRNFLGARKRIQDFVFPFLPHLFAQTAEKIVTYLTDRIPVFGLRALAFHHPKMEQVTCEQIRGHQTKRFAENGQ